MELNDGGSLPEEGTIVHFSVTVTDDNDEPIIICDADPNEIETIVQNRLTDHIDNDRVVH